MENTNFRMLFCIRRTKLNKIELIMYFIIIFYRIIGNLFIDLLENMAYKNNMIIKLTYNLCLFKRGLYISHFSESKI